MKFKPLLFLGPFLLFVSLLIPALEKKDWLENDYFTWFEPMIYTSNTPFLSQVSLIFVPCYLLILASVIINKKWLSILGLLLSVFLMILCIRYFTLPHFDNMAIYVMLFGGVFSFISIFYLSFVKNRRTIINTESI